MASLFLKLAAWITLEVVYQLQEDFLHPEVWTLFLLGPLELNFVFNISKMKI